MGIQIWTCLICSNVSSMMVKKCRKCGAEKPKLGFIEEEHAKEQKKPAETKKKKKASSLDPLISNDDDKIFVSTMKLKD